jgi:hypothetical protein
VIADWVCPKEPIMGGKETFTTLTSITARNDPDITAKVTSSLCRVDVGVP